MPRVVSLTPLTWQTALSRRTYAVVRVARSPRGMPAALVSALDRLLGEGISFGTFDLRNTAKPAFFLNAFRTGQGPMRRGGEPPMEGYYLFRHGLVIAHHPGGSHADAARIARYFSDKLTEPTRDAGERTRWVEEDRVRPGAGWQGGGSGHRGAHQGPYEEQPRDEEPKVHGGYRSRPRAEVKPPQPQAADPYTVIGVERAAGDDEVRKAYKAALKMNHPDRVAHLSPALQAFALAQTQAIREAWETIKDERGL